MNNRNIPIVVYDVTRFRKGVGFRHYEIQDVPVDEIERVSEAAKKKVARSNVTADTEVGYAVFDEDSQTIIAYELYDEFTR